MFVWGGKASWSRRVEWERYFEAIGWMVSDMYLGTRNSECCSIERVLV